LGVEPVLRAILRARSPDGHSLARFITENGFSLTVEPGSALLDNCGVSLVEIIDIKTAESGMNLMVCNTHALNLSQRGKEAVSDPLLIKRSHGSSQKAFSACIAGILCRETDMLSTRNIEFDERPEAGDLLCFLNTAAYLSDFEEASPHQHPKGKKLVVLKRDGKHVLCDENRYFPDLETSYDS
jgi:diaminopimelate decarboxylase